MAAGARACAADVPQAQQGRGPQARSGCGWIWAWVAKMRITAMLNPASVTQKILQGRGGGGRRRAERRRPAVGGAGALT